MSDKDIAEILEEGAQYCIRESWVNYEHIKDPYFRIAVLAATSAFEAYVAACSMVDREAERVLNG